MELWEAWNKKHDEVVSIKNQNKSAISNLKAHKALKTGKYWFDEVDQIIYKSSIHNVDKEIIPFQEIESYQNVIEGKEKI